MKRVKIDGEVVLIDLKMYEAADKISRMVITLLWNNGKTKYKRPLFYTIIIALNRYTGRILDNIPKEDLKTMMRCWNANKNK